MRLTRVLTVLSIALVILCGYLGFSQASSLVLHQEEPPLYWPRSDTHVVGSHIHGRGYVTRAGRSEWGSFAGGGPGGAK